MRAVLLVLLLALGSFADAGDADLGRLERDLEAAARAWDAEAADAVLVAVRELAPGDRSERARTLHARAALLVAELERMAYEQTPWSERERRADRGRKVDEAAEEGLEAMAGMQRGSTHFRLEADLLGTMIRSDFRARKYLDRMRAATAKALELDPDNARALVSQAKPLVFAGPKQGRDPEAARALLDRALELEPGLESALLLRALAWDLSGEPARAESDARAALAANPACAPARHRLETGPPAVGAGP
jgi:tetratricopeptide (TPR) repeat protein